MPRTRWRPPAGTTQGVCPACKTWVSLTPKGYVKEHRVIVRDGRPVSMHTRGAVVLDTERVVRCVGVGRDPRKHTCTPPPITPGLVLQEWKCACGLKWKAGITTWVLA